jgi:hypothetical protein
MFALSFTKAPGYTRDCVGERDIIRESSARSSREKRRIGREPDCSERDRMPF